MRFAGTLELLLLATVCTAQEYVISTYAGGAPPPTPASGLNLSIGKPQGIATDAAGNVFFTSLNCVFKEDQQGVVTRIAGTTRPGYSGDGGPALSAQLQLEWAGFGGTGGAISPAGVAVNKAGDVFVTDLLNHRVRRISPDGIITTVAGNGEQGFSGDDGLATAAQLFRPSGVAVDASGYLYIADAANRRIRRVSPDGIITTVAGNGTIGPFDSTGGDGGPATDAQLLFPTGVAVDELGNLFVVDSGANRIRKVSWYGIITTVAGRGNPLGSCSPSGDGGPAVRAQLCDPSSVTVDSAGNFFFADTFGDFDGDFRQIVRKVSVHGIITTVAGFYCWNFCPPGDGDGGLATRTFLTGALGLAVDAAGGLLISDPWNFRIRKVFPDGTITTVAGGGAEPFADGVPATSANLFYPAGVAADGAFNVFIADGYGNRVRKVSPDGIITTVAGDGARGSSGDGGPAVQAQLSGASSLAVDSSGNIFIADIGNSRVRKVSPDGTITTVAGNGTQGNSGDGGLATNAQLASLGVAADGAGNLFIRSGDRVRKVSSDGIINTVAMIPFGTNIAADTTGNLFIASESGESRVHRVSPDGVITTVAGNGERGFSGDGGLATDAQLFYPSSVAVDRAGNIFIVDFDGRSQGCRIRKVSRDGIITTIAGNGSPGSSGDGGPALNASISFPPGLAVDGRGWVYLTDAYAGVVRVLRPVSRSTDAPARQ